MDIKTVNDAFLDLQDASVNFAANQSQTNANWLRAAALRFSAFVLETEVDSGSGTAADAAELLGEMADSYQE